MQAAWSRRMLLLVHVAALRIAHSAPLLRKEGSPGQAHLSFDRPSAEDRDGDGLAATRHVSFVSRDGSTERFDHVAVSRNYGVGFRRSVDGRSVGVGGELLSTTTAARTSSSESTSTSTSAASTTTREGKTTTTTAGETSTTTRDAKTTTTTSRGQTTTTTTGDGTTTTTSTRAQTSTTTTTTEEEVDDGQSRCDRPEAANATSSEDTPCPESCQLYAREDNETCMFRCVTPDLCEDRSPEEPVPDQDLKICRKCEIDGCVQCKERKDACASCAFGWVLLAGKCYFLARWYWFYIYIGVAIIVFFLTWFTDLASRRLDNEEGVILGYDYHSRARLRQPEDQHGDREEWPVETNLMTTNVGGPALVLFFQFIFFMIMWAFCVGIIWIVLAVMVDSRLFSIGVHDWGTPRTNCIMVAKNIDAQRDLTHVQVLEKVWGSVSWWSPRHVHRMRGS